MDGVFMRKLGKCLLLCVLALSLLWLGSVLRDRKTLNENVIRLHVVADSDEEADQAVKLRVRDAVTAYLTPRLEALPDAQQAKAWLEEHLGTIQTVANKALKACGVSDTAVVSLAREAFDTRHYDSFSLPAGIYDALRITIGEGQGKNWWCVVFPQLCFSATQTGFEDTAAGAGFSEPLTGALEGEQPYGIRFFFLDCLGWLENFFAGF